LIVLILKLNYIETSQKAQNTDPICNGPYQALRTMKPKKQPAPALSQMIEEAAVEEEPEIMGASS